MRLYKVADQDLVWLSEQPESAMAVQLILVDQPAGGHSVVVVAGGRVVWDMSGSEDDGRVARLLDEPWLSGGEAGSLVDRFEAWVAQLPPFGRGLRNGKVVGSRFWIAPIGPFPPPPVPPTTVYGHLPFVGQCGRDEVFYRWEPFPTSRRIDPSTNTVSSGTFTAPFSEATFVASGFGAVGRYALPGLSPANWRWELQPPLGTRFRCGASVPLYGQAGGGVECVFDAGFVNDGPIANPIVLPSM